MSRGNPSAADAHDGGVCRPPARAAHPSRHPYLLGSGPAARAYHCDLNGRRQAIGSMPHHPARRSSLSRRSSTVDAMVPQRALAAAMSTASALGLAVDDAIVLHDSNKLTVRLLPCDVVARVAPTAHQVARFEIGLAQRLAESRSPVGRSEPPAQPRGYERDGFVVTLWTYYQPAMSV